MCDAYKVGGYELLLLRQSSLLTECAWLRYLVGDKTAPAVCDSSEAAHILSRHGYPQSGSSGLRWCLSSSLSLSVGFSIQDEAMDVAYSALQYECNLLASLAGNKQGSRSLGLHKLNSRLTFFLLLCI